MNGLRLAWLVVLCLMSGVLLGALLGADDEVAGVTGAIGVAVIVMAFLCVAGYTLFAILSGGIK